MSAALSGGRSGPKVSLRSLSLLCLSVMCLSVMCLSGARLEARPKAQPKAQSAEASEDAGAFGTGRSQFSLGGGSGSLGGDSYLVLQGRYGYFIQPGLAAQLGLQAWLPLNGGQGLTSLSPGLSYYLYQLKPLIPYAGLFYQHTFTKLELRDTQAFGGRAGFIWSSSGALFGAGLRVTQPFSCQAASCRELEPELTLLLSF